MMTISIVVIMAASVKLGGKAERKGRDVVGFCRCGSTDRTACIYSVGILGHPILAKVTGLFWPHPLL